MAVSAWLLLLMTLVSVPQGTAPRADVLKAICATRFGQGDMARVDVLLDKAGTAKVLALRPDITRFSHAPHTYLDGNGTTLLVVAERPVTPEEAKTDPVLRKLASLTRGLTPGRPVYCSAHR